MRNTVVVEVMTILSIAHLIHDRSRWMANNNDVDLIFILHIEHVKIELFSHILMASLCFSLYSFLFRKHSFSPLINRQQKIVWTLLISPEIKRFVLLMTMKFLFLFRKHCSFVRSFVFFLNLCLLI